MKKIGGILYIEFTELVEAGVSENTIKAGIRRGSANWQSLKDPADSRRLLLVYEKLTRKYQEAINKHYGNPYTLVDAQLLDLDWRKGEELAEGLRINEKEYAAFLRHLPQEEAMDHARAAAWLKLMAQIKRKSDMQYLGFHLKKEMYRVILKRLQLEKLKPLNISNQRVLQRKVKEYREHGIQALLHGLRGNSNAAKLQEEEQKKTLLALASDPHKPDFVTVTYLYNKEAERKDWELLAPSTVRRYLELPEVKRVWWAARHGKDAYYQKYDLTILRKRPTRADALWVLDGTPLDLYYWRKVDKWNEKKQRWEQKTSYFSRMDMILVADACTWRIHSGVLVPNENAASVRRALKQAVKNTMRLPKQLTYDQGSGMAAQSWLIEQLNLINTPTRPYSAKAKVIENIIGHFQTRILRYYDNWAGMNVRAKREDSHANPDFVMANQKNLPNLEQLQEQFSEALEIWNDMATKKRKAPNMAYSSKENAGRVVDPLEFVTLFWEKRRNPSHKDGYPYRNDGIRITINGEEHTFQVTDAALVNRLLGGRYEVAVDPDCLDYIYLYQGGRPVLDRLGDPVIALAAELVPMAVDDYEEGSRATINKLINLKDQVKQSDMQQATEIRKYAKDNGLELSPRYVHKQGVNDTETAIKANRIKRTGNEDWTEIFENKYLQ